MPASSSRSFPGDPGGTLPVPGHIAPDPNGTGTAHALAASPSLVIKAALLASLLADEAASPDREICGLLLGGREIDAIVPAANLAADPRDTFEIDPRALVAAYRAERGGGPRVLGHYHSHPGGAPEPSARDLAAAEPGKLWLIVARGEARLWLARPGGFEAVRLLVR